MYPTPAYPSKRPPPDASPVHGLCDFAQATATLARAVRNPPNMPERDSRNRAFIRDFQYMCSQTPHTRGVRTFRRSQRARSRLRTTSKCIVALPRCVDVNHEGLTHGGRLGQSLHRGAIATYKKQANN